MSGRSRFRKSDHPLLGRIGKPRVRRPRPAVPAQWRLSFLAPANLLLSAGMQTGVVGVAVKAPGPMVEITGHGSDWVLSQCAAFCGLVAGGFPFKCQAVLERLDGERSKACRELVYVPERSVVFVHPLKKAIIFPVRRAA